MFILLTDFHDREWVLDYSALVLATVYSYLVRVPKWLMYMFSASVGTFILNFLHKPSAKDKSKAKPEAVPNKTATSPPPPPPVAPKAAAKTTATSGPKTPSKRRGKK